MFLELPKVTLVAISSVEIEKTIEALKISSSRIKFFDCVLISHERPKNFPENFSFVKIDELKTIDDYNRFCLFDLTKFINSEFALIVQYDGYILRPDKWKEYFLDYDYIGAPWPDGEQWNYIRVGNGGFSLRSKKLLNSMNNIGLPFSNKEFGYNSEDMQLCNYYRAELENSGIRFAPVYVAAEFSHELDVPENCPEPFGFHKFIK
jgi:hypothetical protein